MGCNTEDRTEDLQVTSGLIHMDNHMHKSLVSMETSHLTTLELVSSVGLARTKEVCIYATKNIVQYFSVLFCFYKAVIVRGSPADLLFRQTRCI